MSNENSLPFIGSGGAEFNRVDPSQVELIYAGNLADDDLMWIVRLSVIELRRMIASPQIWVSSLSDLPDWRPYGSDEKGPTPTLTRDFAMNVRLAETENVDGWVTLQGISETNALTLVTNRVAAQKGLEQIEGLGSFSEFWKAVAATSRETPDVTKPFPVNVVKSLAWVYGHLELWEAWMTLAQRYDHLTTFFLVCAADPAGYADMLSRLDQITLYVDGAKTEPGPAITFTSPTTAQTITYACLGGSGQEDVSDTGPVYCVMPDGPYTPPSGGTPGTGQPGTTTVKKYVKDGGVPLGDEADREDPKKL